MYIYIYTPIITNIYAVFLWYIFVHVVISQKNLSICYMLDFHSQQIQPRIFGILGTTLVSKTPSHFKPTKTKGHRENGGTLGMVPLIINPIYSLYIGFLSGISPLKGVLGGLKQLGYHPKGTTIFPMKGRIVGSHLSSFRGASIRLVFETFFAEVKFQSTKIGAQPNIETKEVNEWKCMFDQLIVNQS